MERHKIAQLLPEIFQRTLPPSFYSRTPPTDKTLGQNHIGILGTLLFVMEQMHAPSEKVLQDLATYFDADTVSEAFIPFLAYWVDKDILLDDDRNFPDGTNRLRDLILASVELSKMRGTRIGLRNYLALATGLQNDQIIITESVERSFHFMVKCPNVDKNIKKLIKKIIELEKPANVTYEISYDE